MGQGGRSALAIMPWGSTPCLIPAGGWDTRLVLGHTRGWEVTSTGNDAMGGSR